MFCGLRPVYYYMVITVILRCHIVLSIIIQLLRLLFSPRLFVIILLRLVLMYSWRLPTGLDFLNIQHFRTFFGLRLWFIFAGFCSHLFLLISMNWCREWQFPNLSHTCVLVIRYSFTSNIVIPATFLSNRWWQTSSFLFCSFVSAQLSFPHSRRFTTLMLHKIEF